MATRFLGTNVSLNYAKYRVEPPQELITLIIHYLDKGINSTKQWKTAVDVGCGNGQATRLLSTFFERIYGFDVSETQINEAIKCNYCPNIEYNVAAAESLPIEDNSVDLITVSEAFHWFDRPAFYNEVRRCLNDNGVLAIIGYYSPELYPSGDPKNDAFRRLLYDTYSCEFFAKYTDQRVYFLLDDGYNVSLPFNDFIRYDNKFSYKIPVSIPEIFGFIYSWCSYNLCSKSNPEDAQKVVETFKAELKDLAGESYSDSMKFDMVYNFFLLMARK